MFSNLVANARKETPIFLLISAVLWLVRIVTNYDGMFTPITWAICIALTAISAYILWKLNSVSTVHSLAWQRGILC